MLEYIKREDAIKIAEKYGLAKGSVLGRHTGLADCIASEIATIPAADVVPVVHATWIFGKDMPEYIGSHPKDKWHLFCSYCHHQALNLTVDNDDTQDVETDFCLFCGAKMEEEVKNENLS